MHGFISVYPAEKLYAGGCRNAGLDEDCNSEYTIFLDSDDYFTDGSALQDMHDCAVANGMPDCINVGFNRYAGSKKIYQFDLAASPKDLLAKRCIAPWRKCVRSRFVKRFIPYRRKYNDVVQHFRTCDAIKTVVSLDKPIVTYCNDNKLSAWHLFKSSETDASLFYVIGDLMQEKFQTKACQEYQADYIRKYKAQLK